MAVVVVVEEEEEEEEEEELLLLLIVVNMQPKKGKNWLLFAQISFLRTQVLISGANSENLNHYTCELLSFTDFYLYSLIWHKTVVAERQGKLNLLE